MTAKTFAYQLGETRGLAAAQDASAQGILDTVDPTQMALDAAGTQYDATDRAHQQYVDGYISGWADIAHIPAFLHLAPLDPPVIVTEGQLRAALVKAFPQADVIDYHGRLARFLINHVTATD